MNPDFEKTVQSAIAGFGDYRKKAPFERAAILQKTADSIRVQRDELARLITSENGKPIRDSRAEVLRAENTFTIAAEEAKRIGGEVLPLDAEVQGQNKIGWTRRFPLGPVAAITPFNFPLNLVAHKVAPALACGCSVIVKPSPRTPKIAWKLAEILWESGCAREVLQVFEGGAQEARALAQDERIRVLSFTGSAAVGWELKSIAGKKKVLLELGGNAATIVHADADLKRAVDRLIPGCFAYSGQICISTQRLYLHESIEKPFLDSFLARAKQLKRGDPMDEKTDLGPMIDEAAAKRIEEWVEEALKAGAKLLLGGKREGNFYPPTVLSSVKPNLRICAEENFAPVVVVESYCDPAQAITAVNASRYGLQASLFTNDLQFTIRAFESIEVGALLINEIPGFRVDSMPYGGVKDSGFGREGIRYAIEEMTEPRLMIVHRS